MVGTDSAAILSFYMSDAPTLDHGTYEVLRQRLESHGAELRNRLDALNNDRQTVFGATEMTLLATERVTTQHACVPRDMIAIGKNRFLFAYNIQFGLKQTTALEDVFAVYDYDPADHSFHQISTAEVLGVSSFEEDFAYLYKYYKTTIFAKFMVVGPSLYFAFRTGKSVEDIKVCKFLLQDDGVLVYEGNRFDHEYQFPQQQDFQWKKVTREMHRSGEHPHVSIEDRLFVETVGGDLTVKIEDNTASGHGIYAEDVEDPDQTLDDADISYAIVGPLILLNILPYRENKRRFLLFNEKTQSIHRLDAIGHSCLSLPDNQGLIFANGYKLITGELKEFDHGLQGMIFERRLPSANGEDTLYSFYHRESGDYVLLSYNVIDQATETPIICNGYSVFPNGELVHFKTEEQAQKHHALQVWQTPYLNDEAMAAAAEADQDDDPAHSYLRKIGNTGIVAAMASARMILTLLARDESYGDLYVELVKGTQDLLDAHFWLDRQETRDLAAPLRELNATAKAAIGEFERVQSLRKATTARSNEVEEAARALVRESETATPEDIVGYVQLLARLRRMRGEVISITELRYHDQDLVETLEQSVIKATDALADKTVAYLLEPEALQVYQENIAGLEAQVDGLSKVTEAKETGEQLDAAADELETLIDVVGNLQMDDATQATVIIENISAIYATLNGVRAALKNKRKSLAQAEGSAQFAAQMKLLGQTVTNYLDLCNTEQKTDELRAKLLIQVEELEGRFADFDDYVEQLSLKREEIYNAFETRRTQLSEERSRKTETLTRSANRILGTIASRLGTMADPEDINAYLAGDLMVEKVRGIISQLLDLEESVRADEIQTRLKSTREDALRQLKDRNELYVDGENVIRFGKHAFNVNTQELELSLVPRDNNLQFHLGGTSFYETVEDSFFSENSDLWDRPLISENADVYRAEFAAWQFLQTGAEPTAENVDQFLQPRYAEGYTKGVHDHDALQIAQAVSPIIQQLGLLTFPAKLRSEAILTWLSWRDDEEKRRLLVKLQHRLPGAGQNNNYLAELTAGLIKQGADPNDASKQADYLDQELSKKSVAFAISSEAWQLLQDFQRELSAKRLGQSLSDALAALDGHLESQAQLLTDWMGSLFPAIDPAVCQEAAVVSLAGEPTRDQVIETETEFVISNLKGSHARVVEGELSLNIHDFTARLSQFCETEVPRYELFQDRKSDLLHRTRDELRLDEFKPEVMSAFVRNRLLDEVYLPLIGDNLAKQLGTAGVDTRTDRMGLLLLVSPPGYGKTTLMEYVANRLGLTFLKINGPALGHEVSSLDPAEAPNASAREEVEKLNLGLEMGNNVMLYLDDIQHTNPEFLQKFISLCDGQRKIEGVYKGQAKTYDLRGRKVAVVMAGNPYTETGGKFQIPDMLANRADTYNLGDILGGHRDAFEASYIENSLTSNKVLSTLAARDPKDIHTFMAMAKHGDLEAGELEGNFTAAEKSEILAVMRHLLRVRDTILRVNLAYIESAAQEDAYRTEPAFKLQGSYRNMNRIAEKILPLMTADEVDDIVQDHYKGESQTLTKGAEANLLKFAEMEGIMTEAQTARWAQIKADFAKQKLLGGAGENDPVARIVAQLSQFNDGLQALNQAALSYQKPQSLSETTLSELSSIINNLRAVPVEVEIKVVPVQDDGETPIPDADHDNLPVDVDVTTKQGD